MDNDFFDIAWDAKAGEDLDLIFEYLTENVSENVAQKVKKEIVTAVRRLQTQPESFPPDPLLHSRPENFRYIRLWNYKIVYEFTGREVIVLRIFHFRQNLAEQYKNF